LGKERLGRRKDKSEYEEILWRGRGERKNALSADVDYLAGRLTFLECRAQNVSEDYLRQQNSEKEERGQKIKG